MHDERGDSPLGRPEETRPIVTPLPRPSTGLGVAIAVVVAVVALLALTFWLRRERRPPAPQTQAAAGTVEAAPAAAAAAPVARPLPALDASDLWVREAVATLSAHPQLAAWLLHDDLVRRLVAAVIQIADGRSPSGSVAFLRPAEGFRASRSAGRWFVDVASFRRYDRLTDVVVSLDAAAAARLLREMQPLLERAYAEIGDPSTRFDATLARALANLVAVPIPAGEPELARQGELWTWAERDLEQRTPAEKHLLRFGAENARRLQAKLRELAAAAGIPLA